MFRTYAVHSNTHVERGTDAVIDAQIEQLEDLERACEAHDTGEYYCCDDGTSATLVIELTDAEADRIRALAATLDRIDVSIELDAENPISVYEWSGGWLVKEGEGDAAKYHGRMPYNPFRTKAKALACAAKLRAAYAGGGLAL